MSREDFSSWEDTAVKKDYGTQFVPKGQKEWGGCIP